MEVRCLKYVAGAQVALGRPKEAVEAARAALDLIPQFVGEFADEASASARAGYAEVYEFGAQAAIGLDDPATLLHFIESGRAGALLESLKSRQSLRRIAIPPALAAAEIEARKRERAASALYHRARRAGDDVEALHRNVEKAERDVQATVERIQREAKARAGVVYPRALSLPECQATLRAGDAMVHYALLPNESFALVVEPEAARIVKLGATDKLRKTIESFERAVMRPDERGIIRARHLSFSDLTTRMRRLVVDPLGLGKHVRRVLISPDGRLAYVPFCVLLAREVTFLPSATTYQTLAAEASKRGSRVLALGDPDYKGGQGPPEDPLAARDGGGAQPRLLASAKEARAVGDVVLLSDKATVAGLRTALRGSVRWRAVHLACHGRIDPERPVLSSLLLTPGKKDDGFLRCLDVFRMHIPADLAVLSACETGKGKVYRAEGVVGFTRAFLFAGCPRVIVSVWNVDDKATHALMEKFYELWKKGKTPAADALRQAQQHVASQTEWKHPYFWAAWQLWGLPD